MATDCHQVGGFVGPRPDDYYGEVLPDLYKKNGDTTRRSAVRAWISDYTKNVLPALMIDRETAREMFDSEDDN